MEGLDCLSGDVSDVGQQEGYIYRSPYIAPEPEPWPSPYPYPSAYPYFYPYR